MNAARLRRLRHLLGDALARPAADRDAFVQAATAGDDSLAAELQTLLAAATADDPRFEPLVAPAPPEPPLVPGERVGAWRLARQLGTGGMGEVWLAERADGAYRQQVAIKLPRTTRRGPAAFARFERERALLAELEHPGVARLVDGGWTDAGRPWLAMEYVAGRPIDAHAAAHHLDTRARVPLLLDACRALAAAHRRRIVHRDLKPGNVLVRDDGAVVLVDFGIAAALGHPTADLAHHLATPRYAAPEQLRGEPTTTAADVYSLARLGSDLIATDDRDLQAVFAAATHDDPERRTATADAFAEELSRWLRHLPVEARRPTPWQRLQLAFRRDRRTTLAIGTLAAAVLGAGTAAAVAWRGERAERQRAETAHAAEVRRHAQVRALVREIVFGVHDRIAVLPGAVPARAFLVERAEAHLTALAADCDDDPALAWEIAAAWLRLADVRGARTHGNLGDPEGARRSAMAANQLAAAWIAQRPDDAAWTLLLARSHRQLGDLLRARGELAAARGEYERAQAALALPAAGGTAEHRRAAGGVELQLGKLAAAGGAIAAGLVHFDAARRQFDALVAEQPGSREARRDAALARSEQAFTLAQAGRDGEARAAWTAALAGLDALATEHPGDAQLRRDRLEVRIELASSGGEDDPGTLDELLAEARAQLAADDGNMLAERLLHRALLRSARFAAAGGDAERSVHRYREVEPLLQAMLEQSPGERDVRVDLAEARIGRAEAERRLGATADVAAAFTAGLSLLDPDAALRQGDHFVGSLLTMAWAGLANAALAAGDAGLARSLGERFLVPARAWAERHADLPWPPRHLGVLEHALGSAYEALGGEAGRPVADRIACLQAAGAAFDRGRAIAERLAAAGRLRGADRALPRLFASDVQRVAAAAQSLIADPAASGSR